MHTGCDTVSAFSDKVKPLKLMMKSEKYVSNSASIGKEVEISTSSFDALVEFVCELYGYKENSTDYVGYRFYILMDGQYPTLLR